MMLVTFMKQPFDELKLGGAQSLQTKPVAYTYLLCPEPRLTFSLEVLWRFKANNQYCNKTKTVSKNVRFVSSTVA